MAVAAAFQVLDVGCSMFDVSSVFELRISFGFRVSGFGLHAGSAAHQSALIPRDSSASVLSNPE